MIYHINLNFDYAVGNIVKEESNASFLELNSESISLLKAFKFDWNTEDSSAIPNLTLIMSELFCCDIVASELLKDIMGTIQFNNLFIGDNQFFSISNIPIKKNAINLKASKVKYFSTGDIMEIEKWVFNQDEYPPIFKAEEMPGVFFCTEIFKDTIEKNHLTGLIFTECKIKSKSWFSK